MTREKKSRWGPAVVALLVLGIAVYLFMDRGPGANGDPDGSTESATGAGTDRGTRSTGGRPTAADRTKRIRTTIGGIRTWPAAVERDEAAIHGLVSGVVVSFASGQPVPSAELTFAHADTSVSVVSR